MRPERTRVSRRPVFFPLSNIVPAHVTLVFPFSTDISVEALISHVVAITSSFKPIKTILAHCRFQEDGYIHGAVLDECKGLSALHTQAYSGILQSFRDPRFPFQPHLTIGRHTPAS